MNFTEIFYTFGSNVWLYAGSFILVLSILVFVHEWGHYIVARMCGVRVETFSIGFGKEIWGINDKNGTRWKLSLIPMGGYVKLFGDLDPASVKHKEGEEDKTGHIRPHTAAERKQAFYAQSVAKRSAIVFAGPLINYIFAIILLAGLYMTQGQPVTPPEAAAIIGGSSADKYDFRPHDIVVSIGGRSVESFEDIRREMMIALDGEREFVILRDGKEMKIMAAPQLQQLEDRFGFKQSRGLLGLISPRHAIRIDSITKIDGRAYKDPAEIRKQLTRRMGSVFTIEVERGASSDVLTVQPLASLNAALSDSEHKDHDLLYISEHKGDVFVKFGPLSALYTSLRETWNITQGTLEAIGQIITGSRSATELGGVIRIGALAGDVAKQGLVPIILFTALLSINLGLINLFPIPLLDGGHLVFYAFEAVFRRPVPEQIQEYAFRLGFAFLVGIMVFANLNDIMQLIL
jgi:regulator of sigma E protease